MATRLEKKNSTQILCPRSPQIINGPSLTSIYFPEINLEIKFCNCLQGLLEDHEIDEAMLFELDSVTGYWNEVAEIDMDEKMKEDEKENDIKDKENEDDEYMDVEVELTGKARWYAVGGQAPACLLKVGSVVCLNVTSLV